VMRQPRVLHLQGGQPVQHHDLPRDASAQGATSPRRSTRPTPRARLSLSRLPAGLFPPCGRRCVWTSTVTAPPCCTRLLRRPPSSSPSSRWR
jgi:hypothetical protein